jgi:hypothetical protein
MKSRSSASRYLPMKGQTMDITIAKTPRQAANTAVPLNTIKAVDVPPDWGNRADPNVSPDASRPVGWVMIN